MPPTQLMTKLLQKNKPLSLNKLKYSTDSTITQAAQTLVAGIQVEKKRKKKKRHTHGFWSKTTATEGQCGGKGMIKNCKLIFNTIREYRAIWFSPWSCTFSREFGKVALKKKVWRTLAKDTALCQIKQAISYLHSFQRTQRKPFISTVSALLKRNQFGQSWS